MICFRRIHRETRQPHRYALALTTSRNVTKRNWGGDFILADYGILVEADTNTLMEWEVSDWHGTSLPDMDPSERETTFYQAGIAFVTSPTIEGVWLRLAKEEISEEEAVEMLETLAYEKSAPEDEEYT